MIRVLGMYPHQEGAKFDWDYYLGKHTDMVRERLGDALRELHIDEGIAGGASGEPPAYLAVAHLAFDSVEAFTEAFGPHVAEIMGDIPNFTDVTPVLQISEVRL